VSMRLPAKPDWPDAQFGAQKAPAWRGQGTKLASLCRICGRFMVGPPTQHFCSQCQDDIRKLAEWPPRSATGW
jgi:hypothetical protein